MNKQDPVPPADDMEDIVVAPGGLYVEFDTGRGNVIRLRMTAWNIDKDGLGVPLVECPWDAEYDVVVGEAQSVADEFGWEITWQPRPLYRTGPDQLFWGDLDPEHGPDVGPPYTRLDPRHLEEAAA